MEPDRPAAKQYAADDEERFRLLVKNSPDMVFRRTLEGVFREVSAAGPVLLGCPVEEIVGTAVASWVHPEDVEDFESAEQDLLRSGRVVVCLRLRHADGHWLWTESTSWVVRDAAGEPLEVRGFIREAEGQRRREEALRLLQEQARSVIETARDAFVSIDEDGLVIDWNQAAQALFGWSRQEVMGRLLAETIIPARYREAHAAGLRRVLAGGEPHVLGRQIEISALHHDGREIPVELGVWRLQSGAACFNAFIRDITERKQAEEAVAAARDRALEAWREAQRQAQALAASLREQTELQGQLSYQATHDPLTGLANRELLNQRLESALGRCSAMSSTGLLMLDLDDFKDVNDTLGHPAGDELLVGVARRLTGRVRKQDILVRLGGDEFAILVEDVDASTLHVYTTRILASFQDPFTLAHSHSVHVTTSIGVRGITRPTAPSEALRDADTALYRAKTAGKNQAAFFEPPQQPSSSTAQDGVTRSRGPENS